MSKQMRKRGSSFCVLALTSVLALTACSSNVPNKDGGQKAVGDGNQTAAPQASTKKEPPVPIRMFASDNTVAIPNKKSMEFPAIKYWADQVNVNMDITFIPHANYAEQLRLKFASGDLPDVYQSWGISSEEAIANDQVLPLNDLLQKYGPNLLKEIPQESWDAVTLDGKIMAIPQTAIGNAPAERMIYVRKDWMDKLHLSVPKTSDEFLNMLRAFRDGDPNGNNKKDEIPFTMREKLSWGENIFGMFGVNPGSNSLYNGEIIPDIIHPNMKLALAYMKTMVDEKLMDPEFLTNTSPVWMQKIKSGVAGSWNHGTNWGWMWQSELDKSIPDQKPDVVVIPTPRGVGYNGPLGRTKLNVQQTYMIMKNAKNPEAIVRMFDWLATKEGKAFVSFGIPGETYKEENGKYVYDMKKDMENPINDWRKRKFVLTYDPAIALAELGQQAFDKSDLAYSISRKEGLPNLTEAMPQQQALLDNPDLAASGALFQEAAAKILLGTAPLDSFDEYVKTYREQGGDALIKQMTEWYNKNVKK